MKFKTTQKAVKATYNNIISVPYCNLQNLLSYESPIAYTVRREGWGADIYSMGGGVAIVTGYAPFGNIRPAHDLLERYDTQAEKIRNLADYKKKMNRLKELQQEFIEEVSK